MKTCIIINPNAGSVERAGALERTLKAAGDMTCWTTAAAGDGTKLANRAVEEGFELIVAAGGDGTIHEVACALIEARTDAVMGLMPAGTGNDLARTLALPFDVDQAAALMLAGEAVRTIDAVRVEAGGRSTYAVNACSGGFSGQVDEVLTDEMKKTWGPLAFLLGAVEVLPDLEDYVTRIVLDDAAEETVRVYNVIVANGRTVGGGRRVAPRANPEDGLLDVVLVEAGSLLEMAEVSTRLLAGDWLESPHVTMHRARRVRLESTPGMWFNVDGELFTREPVTFTVLPGALRMLVGPEYRADVDD